ncbi:MAG TPA: YCF48-related protein [Candidatus Binatia bacterium]|nr:YCF48-related protein [Candidatus Binatia bacterium]
MHFLYACLTGLILGLAPLNFHSQAAGALKETAVNENFYGVHIFEERAWIVGYYGAILYSPDRGLTWQIQRSPVQNALFNVGFVSPTKGWISGSYGTILHTTDAGQSWRQQQAGTTEHFLGLAMIDESHGRIVGSRGTTLRTEDGGRSWITVLVPGDFTFSGVSFIDPYRGWIAGEFGVIFRTSDGGKTWVKQKSPVEVSFSSGESRHLFALNFNRANAGYAFGLDGLVLKTTTGNDWTVIRQRPEDNRSTGANHLFAAARINDQLWAAGERGTLLKSDSGGKHWRQAGADLPRVSLNGIAFGKNGFGLAVGNRGVILRTEDGGASWKRLKMNGLSSAKDLSLIP